MTCTLSIAAYLTTKPWKYKYVIYSPKMTQEADCFEYLHYFRHTTQDPNRCLMINQPVPYGKLNCFNYVYLQLN